MTTGKLSKKQLVKNRQGKIVSKAKSVRAKRASNLGKMLASKKRHDGTGRLTNVDESNIIKGKRRRGKKRK